MALAPNTPTAIAAALEADGFKVQNLGAIVAVVGETACMLVEPKGGPNAGSPIWFTCAAGGSSDAAALTIANKMKDMGYNCIRQVLGSTGADVELMYLLRDIGGGYYTTAGHVGENNEFLALFNFLAQRDA